MTAVLLAVAVAVAVVVGGGPAWAHPGRLDTDGCHHVRTRFVYKSGQVAEPGEFHCHRKLDRGFKLDGREVLQDPQSHDDRPEWPPRPKERR
ncbi:MAG: YHYH domain-containing protein [Tepidiformaceae bacterium]